MRHFVSVIMIGTLLFITCSRVTSTRDNKTKNQLEQETTLVLKKLDKAMNEHNLDAIIGLRF
jgi:hypothetical protein